MEKIKYNPSFPGTFQGCGAEGPCVYNYSGGQVGNGAYVCPDSASKSKKCIPYLAHLGTAKQRSLCHICILLLLWIWHGSVEPQPVVLPVEWYFMHKGYIATITSPVSSTCSLTLTHRWRHFILMGICVQMEADGYSVDHPITSSFVIK